MKEKEFLLIREIEDVLDLKIKDEYKRIIIRELINEWREWK